MTDISPIGRSAPIHAGLPPAPRAVTEAATTPRATDQVEVSEVARWVARLHELPEVRQDLIDSIKAQIQAGTYETSDKIDAAIEGLAEDLA